MRYSSVGDSAMQAPKGHTFVLVQTLGTKLSRCLHWRAVNSLREAVKYAKVPDAKLVLVDRASTLNPEALRSAVSARLNNDEFIKIFE